jgi:hypothetical protein
MCVGYSGGNEISSYISGWHGFWTILCNIAQLKKIFAFVFQFMALHPFFCGINILKFYFRESRLVGCYTVCSGN